MKMGWFDLFRGSTRRSKTGVSQEDHRRLVATVSQVKARLSNLDAQLGTIHLTLHKHDDEIAGCRGLTGQHSDTLKQLEELVSRPPTPSAPSAGPGIQANESTPMRPTVPSVPAATTQQLDISLFSEQQKRLLAVFFENRDRQLSYADVAVRLGRSPCTIKNQINKIRRKADLFECSSGPQNRNYFRLKDDLRVERLLKIGRSRDQPGTMPWPDPARYEPVQTPAGDSFSYPKVPTQQ